MNLLCSYLVPFAFSGAAGLCGCVSRLAALLEFLADHTNFEKNSAGLDALTDGFELRRSHLLRAVRDVEKHAFEFVEYASERGISLFERCFAV
jgi:hypothetical protein